MIGACVVARWSRLIRAWPDIAPAGGSRIETETSKMSTSTVKPPASSSFEIHYVTGDLFRCPVQDALAHCISEDCRMGAGIAVLFKRKFRSVKELLNQKKKTGDVAVLKTEQRYIYYLITKEKAWHKPTYDSLQSSLEAMKKHCLNNGVAHISMPRIGSGLDKLMWNEVAARIQNVFQNTDIIITVYSLQTPVFRPPPVPRAPLHCKRRKYSI